MPINKERKLPHIGKTYTRVFSGKSYTVKVVRANNGVAYNLGGNTFVTPTAAAKSITKYDVNGWRFWRIP
jgi:hypothetical protein